MNDHDYDDKDDRYLHKDLALANYGNWLNNLCKSIVSNTDSNDGL